MILGLGTLAINLRLMMHTVIPDGLIDLSKKRLAPYCIASYLDYIACIAISIAPLATYIILFGKVKKMMI